MEMNSEQPNIIIEEVSDPLDIARHLEQESQFARNLDWVKSHWDDLAPRAVGKFVAVAGQEAFIADTALGARQWVNSAHPEDRGAWVYFMRPGAGPRSYANRGSDGG